jgi:putative Mg2+ transporter-C (MgtC) family protein
MLQSTLETLFGPAMEAPDQWYQGPARLVLAVLFGAVAGFERESKGHFAGLRTYAMVSLGAAGFALISTELFEYMLTAAPDSAGHATRIISAIVGGIGFLGAGAIIQSGGRIQGLTTAAGLWAIAAAGAAAGLALAPIALTVAVLCLLVLLANRLDSAIQRVGDGRPQDPKTD